MNRSWAGRKHNEYWQSICTKGRQTAFLQDPLLKAFKNYSTSAEPELGIMMGPPIGHCHLEEHLFEVGQADSPGCDRYEQATKTTMHFGCEALATLRF
jgi:hypothetical protein